MQETPETRASLLVRMRDPLDERAWSEFALIYEPLVYRLARRQGLQDADSRDLTQHVLMAVAARVERWDSDRSKGSFRGWLFRVSRNLIVNLMIHQRRHPPGSGDSNVQRMLNEKPAPEGEESAFFDVEFRRQLFRRAADQVCGEFRETTWEAFWQTCVDGHDIKQVAEKLDLTVGAVCHDVRMHDGCFASKSLPRRTAAGVMRRHHLHSDVAIQLTLITLQHDTHSTTADQFENLILAQPPNHGRIVGRIEEIECEFDRPQLVGRKKLLGRHSTVCLFVNRKIIVAGTQEVTCLVPPFLATGKPLQHSLASPTRFEMVRRGALFVLPQLTSKQESQSLAFTFTGLSVHLQFLLQLFDFHSQPSQHATACDVIHSVDAKAKLPYLVMPFVAAKSLQARINHDGPLGLTEILRIGKQAAEGLAAAHAQGLVHRDIKPANILLEDDVGRVLLTDFGLARAVDDATMTRSGVIAGTPQYMSPEQAHGQSIDHRADLFSLAVCCTPWVLAIRRFVRRRRWESSAASVKKCHARFAK
jgi:RNA polymerase sigma factor (sigma-70 family)